MNNGQSRERLFAEHFLGSNQCSVNGNCCCCCMLVMVLFLGQGGARNFQWTLGGCWTENWTLSRKRTLLYWWSGQFLFHTLYTVWSGHSGKRWFSMNTRWLLNTFSHLVQGEMLNLSSSDGGLRSSIFSELNPWVLTLVLTLILTKKASCESQ